MTTPASRPARLSGNKQRFRIRGLRPPYCYLDYPVMTDPKPHTGIPRWVIYMIAGKLALSVLIVLAVYFYAHH